MSIENKMTDEQEETMARELTIETIEAVFEAVATAVNKLERADVNPAMAFQLIRAVGFAVCGSGLVFFPGDEAKASAAKQMIDDFKDNISQGLALNMGMDKHPTSSIIIQ